MRSRHIWMAVAVCIVLASGQQALARDVPVKVYVDGKQKSLDPPALLRDGTTYVPLRAGAGAVGATVKWEESTQRALITRDDKTAAIKKSQGIIVKDRLLIPLRLMGEALGCDVKWDAAARAVRIDIRVACSGGT